jgi:hypothetical protein
LWCVYLNPKRKVRGFEGIAADPLIEYRKRAGKGIKAIFGANAPAEAVQLEHYTQIIDPASGGLQWRSSDVPSRLDDQTSNRL